MNRTQAASHPTAARRSASLATGLALFTGLMAAAGVAQADPSPALDRMSLSVGGFYVKPKIQIGADTRYGRLDSPEEKGSSETLPRAKAEILIGDKHAISADYYRYDNAFNPSVSGNTVIDGDPVTGIASANGKLQLDLAKVAYKWYIGEGNSVFAVGAGAAYYRAKLEGSATATVRGTINGVAQTRTVTGTASDSESTYAPLLELGWRHALNDQVRIFADASGVKKNGGKVNGHIYSGAVGVEWFALKNVGLVVDYGMQRIDLRRDSLRDANLRIKLAGPSAYVKVRF